MLINEILYENHYRKTTDKLSVGHDKSYNPEAEFYAEEERERTKKIWNEANGGVPVIETPEKDPEEQDFRPFPESGEIQSPGYRGEQKARQRAGADYKPYDKGFPSYNFTID